MYPRQTPRSDSLTAKVDGHAPRKPLTRPPGTRAALRQHLDGTRALPH